MNNTTQSPKNESPTRIPPNPSGLCGCGCGQTTKVATQNRSNRDWVKGEYKRYISGHNSGSPLTTEEHFWDSVDKSDDCWLWTAAKAKNGYGLLRIKGEHGFTHEFTHRYSYQLAYGPIPDSLCVLHSCDVRNCIRPDHLFLGTRLDNAVDCKAKGRTLRGEKHHKTKLSDDGVRQLRIDFANGVLPAALSERYGIDEGYAYQVAKGKARKYVE